MKILFIGDICGRNARTALCKYLPQIKQQNGIDITIANVENASHGRGASIKAIKELQSAGIDAFTSGNHIWRHPDYQEILENSYYNTIRPINYPEDVYGTGSIVVNNNGKRLQIINIMGVDLINERTLSEPFRYFDSFLEKISYANIDAILVDFHAEATSEKKAFGYYFDSSVSVIVGTHTHVQTADEEILPNGTAYITDVGMTGPKDSILWTQKDIIFNRMKYPYGKRFEISSDKNIVFNAVIVETKSPHKASHIQRLNSVLKI